MENKKVIVMGGGTFSYVRNHLALAAPAFGETAKKINYLIMDKYRALSSELVLTKMANPMNILPRQVVREPIVTNQDVADYVKLIKKDLNTKIVFFNVALCDFEGTILDEGGPTFSGKYAPRLKTSKGVQDMVLIPAGKIVKSIREGRKDIFLVTFKTTCNATEQEQYLAGLDLLKKASCNLVLANDTGNHRNMIITPEEAKYCVTTDRDKVIAELVDMAYLRSQLTFTRSTVVAGELVPWASDEVYPSLRKVVDYCIEKNAYKPFNGATVGHFACKIADDEFLTSIRKSNFNDLHKNGLVRIKTDGPDTVIAYGAKPSVGGQSQRIIFSEHNDYDCIAHFHCPIKEGSEVPVISQKEYECGSHQCGQNTSNGLKQFGNLSAVMLDNHGPNIVFNHNIDPQEVIDFIEANFDLADKTGGLFN